MKIFRVILGVIVSVFFLYLVFSKVALQDTLQVMATVKWPYIAVLVAVAWPVLQLRGLRWRFMFEEQKGLKQSAFFESITVGTMANNLFPFRIGELAQLFFLHYKTGLSKTRILSTIVVEKVCDIIVMGMILFCGSFFVLMPKEIPRGRIYLLVAAIFICIIVVILLRSKVIWVLRKVLPEGKVKNRILGIVEEFYHGVDFIHNPVTFIKVLLMTSVLWFFWGFCLYLCMLSLGIRLPPLTAWFLLSIAGLGAMIPATPAGIGPLEFFITVGVGIFGIEKTYGVSLAIIYRLVSWPPPTLIGLYVLLKNKFSIKQIAASSRKYSESSE